MSAKTITGTTPAGLRPAPGGSPKIRFVNDEHQLQDWDGPPIPIESLSCIGAGGEMAIEALCRVRMRPGENHLEQIVRQVFDMADPSDPMRANLYRIGFFSTLEVILSTIDMDYQQMVNLARGAGVF